MRTTILAALVVAAMAHALAWFVAARTTTPPDISNTVESMSFNVLPPDTDKLSPEEHARRRARIDDRLRTIAGMTRTVRSYSSVGDLRALPELAQKHHLNVSLGAWLSSDEAQNRKEIEAVVELAKRHRNVKSVIVGNETILRKARSVEQLIASIREVKRRVSVPVSTGETWDIWLRYPQLANAVDFIAVHILPYWEGVPAGAAVDYAMLRYEELRRAFPGKKIVIAEFGWPSQGYNNRDATPGKAVQAEVIRRFIAEARARGIYYNVIEAFDQPWKTAEGSVGPYWGMFNAAGKAKFTLAGPIKPRSGYRMLALSALAIGATLTLVGLFRRRPTFGHALAYGLAANAMGAGIAMAAAYPFTHYMTIGAWVMWTVGFLLMIPLVIMTLAKIHEMAEVLLGRRPRRLVPERTALPADPPMVSIHIPAYREPPQMLKETLDSVAALDYPNFEAVVIINNTPEESYWAPIEAHCRALGGRFKFLNVPKLSGFKAGALNEALKFTAPQAEVIAVIDADYVVHRNWLRDLVPHFRDSAVGLIQAPQDHRDGERSVLKAVMNSEYAGFFDIGMIQRNEDDAIVQHGTLCLVRRSALEQVGGWSSDTIVEDTELGLRLFESGYHALYTNRRYGWGLLPDSFTAFKTQRERWAYGAMQIIRKHWRHMLPRARTLTPEQKHHFVTGWMYWLSDALGAAAAILNLIWVPAILFVGVLIPTIPLTVPIITAFIVNLLHCALLYRSRVRVPIPHIVGAALAAMSLQLTIAGAVLKGLVRDNLPFKRTDKGGQAKKKAAESPVRWETLLGLALISAAVILYLTNETRILELNVFALTLAIQSLPFLAAMLMHAIEKYESTPLARHLPLARLAPAK
jgi:cellulose synthase/poly-beta-1,6-N-acetylglucosamine synthase-like glycosyltransferase/exo-beta-1,3-glucanase (GH17 family)